MKTDLKLFPPTPTAQTSILVAAADGQHRRQVREALTASAMYRWFEAGTQEAAFRIIDELPIDIVICGAGLLGDNCTETLSRMEVAGPVIVISADPSIELAKACILGGATDYVSLPLDGPSFSTLVEDTIDAIKQEASFELDCVETMTMTQVFGSFTDYRLLRILGEGQMGVVYLARHCKDNCLYAVKIIKSSLITEEDQLDLVRFYNEIDLLRKLSHPNIVAVKETGYAGQDLIPYFAMEYVNGRPLRLFCSRLLPLSLAGQVMVIQQIADALDRIHNLDVVHRDIKPDNILVLDDGTAKLLDFGVARMPNSDLTEVSEMIGTPNYFAPECFRDDESSSASDIFSLGVVAYELFSSQKPFVGTNLMAICAEICQKVPLPLDAVTNSLSPSVTDLVMSMLEKEPAKRPSAREVSDGLKAFITTTSPAHVNG